MAMDMSKNILDLYVCTLIDNYVIFGFQHVSSDMHHK